MPFWYIWKITTTGVPTVLHTKGAQCRKVLAILLKQVVLAVSELLIPIGLRLFGNLFGSSKANAQHQNTDSIVWVVDKIAEESAFTGHRTRLSFTVARHVYHLSVSDVDAFVIGYRDEVGLHNVATFEVGIGTCGTITWSRLDDFGVGKVARFKGSFGVMFGECGKRAAMVALLRRQIAEERLVVAGFELSAIFRNFILGTIQRRMLSSKEKPVAGLEPGVRQLAVILFHVHSSRVPRSFSDNGRKLLLRRSPSVFELDAFAAKETVPIRLYFRLERHRGVGVVSGTSAKECFCESKRGNRLQKIDEDDDANNKAIGWLFRN
ncbi:hypothetical protein WR25_21742 [Diploscapter pachys]|uniref:Uncharacterized protein n=1 Tax=Diploscapter pachys TaxID=2018661 RepID=A0A2A2JHB9_9BILA|nr:hypothetical protein WR25_21742 [Diploscapter pachys]